METFPMSSVNTGHKNAPFNLLPLVARLASRRPWRGRRAQGPHLWSDGRGPRHAWSREDSRGLPASASETSRYLWERVFNTVVGGRAGRPELLCRGGAGALGPEMLAHLGEVLTRC